MNRCAKFIRQKDLLSLENKTDKDVLSLAMGEHATLHLQLQQLLFVFLHFLDKWQTLDERHEATHKRQSAQFTSK